MSWLSRLAVLICHNAAPLETRGEDASLALSRRVGHEKTGKENQLKATNLKIFKVDSSIRVEVVLVNASSSLGVERLDASSNL
jgi:hypothetical protein